MGFNSAFKGLNTKLGGSQNRSGNFGVGKKGLTRTGIRTLDYPARTPADTPNMLFRRPFHTKLSILTY